MILAIETATEVCAAALVENGRTISERAVTERNIHSERLLQLIDDMLKEAGVPPSGLSAVAVSIGPGSFTGLRIGLSTAKGLALALGIPIVPVPTLDAVAEEFRQYGEGNFCAMIDAKREESFFAFYEPGADECRRVTEVSITLRAAILQEASQRNASVEQPPFSAAAVGRIGERRRSDLSRSDFSDLEPFYLRDFVATTPKKPL